MDRDELEETVRALRKRMNEMEERLDELDDGVRFGLGPATVRLISQLSGSRDGIDDDEDVADEIPNWDDGELIPKAADAVEGIEEAFDRLSDLENTLQRHESLIEEGQAVASDRQGQHWKNVIEMAQNVRDDHTHHIGDEWVVLYKDDVAKATGVSKRRASQLIDEWTEDDSAKYKSGTRVQSYQPPTAGESNSARKKAIKLDLEVWGDK